MDRNLGVVVKDLRVLIMILFYDDVKGGYTDMRIPVRRYFAANAEIIKRGLDAVRQLTEAEAEKLRDDHKLHYSIADDTEYWFDYNHEIVARAVELQERDPDESFPHPHYDDSRIEPLMRMLEYAVFIADTSDYSVEFSPVVDHLPAEVIARRKEKLEPYMRAV